MKRLTLVLFLACVGLGCSAPDRPNILFIMADDLGYGELGCYGCKDIHTPVLDHLAEQGIRFTDFYANAPVCSPTRLSFLTGRYQQRFGAEDHPVRGQGIPPESPSKNRRSDP